MEVVAVLAGIVSLLIIFPIWFYLLHYVLIQVGAGELQMFLFWVYVPLHLFMALLKVVVDSTVKK